MEKDLRDAYKALQLMRADLQRTRKEKEALEREAAALRSDNTRLRAENEQQSERTTEPPGSVDGDDAADKTHLPQHDTSGSNQQPQKQEQDDASDPEAPPAIVDEMVREKLGLLANLYSLKSKLDEQAAAMLAQQAAFAQERDELCMQLEELSDQFTQLQTHALDREHEKQFMEEKYEFLVTELELLKREREQSMRLDAESEPVAPSPTAAAVALDDLQRENDALRQELEDVLRQQRTLEAAAVAATEREAESEQRRVALEATVERVTREWEAANADVQAATRAFGALQTQTRTLETELAAHDATVAALARDKQQLIASIAATDDERQREVAQLQELHRRQLAANDTAVARSHQAAEAVTTRLERQVNAFETQHMALEDTTQAADSDSDRAAFDAFATLPDSDAHVRAWAFVGQKVRSLGRFLAQLQSFAAVADATLSVCDANARALAALSPTQPLASRRVVTQDVVSLLRVVAQLEQRVAVSSHAKLARGVHHDVLELLTHWYESPGHDNDDADASPAPPFGIASREAALVLQNWTADSGKRRAAQRWLERIETVDGSSDDDSILGPDGSTLELQHMTAEVKQAFAVLLVPILRRNRTLYVRVFTRRTEERDRRRSQSVRTEQPTADDDATWEMKIHVQRRQRPRGPTTTPTTSAQRKLELIQARLHHLQKR